MTAQVNPGRPRCPYHPLDRGIRDEETNQPGLYKSAGYNILRDSTDTGVVEVQRRKGKRAYLITRYEDVKHVLREQTAFSRANALAEDEVDVSGTLLGLDGTEHAAVRGLVKNQFMPQAIARHRPVIEHRAAEQLKSMCEQGEPVDLLAHFAFPLPLHVICDLLGLPQGEERLRFRDWATAFLGTSAQTRAGVEEAQQAMGAYLGGLLAQRAQQPSDDLLTQIAVAGGEAGVPFEQLISLAVALVLGGWETVASSICTHLEVLLTHPYRDHATGYAYLTDHPEEIPGAVAELQRMFSTTANDDMPRKVMRDVTLPSGAQLPAGAVVIPSHDAANFDWRVIENPHRMDFDRPVKHMSFGYGPHHCIGRHLGQDSEVAALRVLTSELPGLRLADAHIPRKVDQTIPGPLALRVVWTRPEPVPPRPVSRAADLLTGSQTAEPGDDATDRDDVVKRAQDGRAGTGGIEEADRPSRRPRASAIKRTSAAVVRQLLKAARSAGTPE
jgi:cytochrome P450